MSSQIGVKFNSMSSNFVYLNSFSNISEDTFEILNKLTSFRRIKAKTIITETGEIPTKYYFLVSGLMRAYLNSETGKLYTKNIFSPVSFVASFTALINRKPSKLTYETLTDCKVYELDYTDMMNLCKENLSVSLLYSKILEQVFVGYEKRNLELLTLNATQRYIKLRMRIPNIDGLIPQYQIASFLNITPVQLSRIRKIMNK
ncbi:MAG: Crp/Fnr family transcriptional regulator [Flavobacteriaceae bacterium]|nr:Crp/Fnr family transcriptional regulator [Flavobacteriaceae bacterium]